MNWQPTHLKNVDGKLSYDWSEIENRIPWIGDLASIDQDRGFHGEGNVLNHTRMVLEALFTIDYFHDLAAKKRYALFLAALMHDMGKLKCTKMENGRITSRNHARKGASMARIYMYQDPAERVPFHLREHVAALIELHSLPLWLVEREDPEGTVIRGSQLVDLELLALLAEADVKGRVCSDGDELLAKIDLFRDTCRELNCFKAPYAFSSNLSRYQYFQKEGRSPSYAAYDDTEFDVVLMSGLPGAGKDHWIRKNLPEYPMVSLDGIRTEMKILPTQKQHKVIEEAKAQAKACLRQRQSFVWNATNITNSLRRHLVQLFAGYKAKVRIVYVEPEYAQLVKQNENREDRVPANVMNDMLRRLEIPRIYEAHEVTYVVNS